MLVVPADVTDAASMTAAAARVRDELGPIDLVVLSAGYWQQMSRQRLGHRQLRPARAGQPRRHEQRDRGGAARDAGPTVRASSPASPPSPATEDSPGSEAYGATKAGQINLLEALRIRVAGTGVHVTTVCPGFVRTEMTAGNDFPMPFIVEADAAGRAICDGLERERTEIVFPLRMAILMKAARFVPVRMWVALSPGPCATLVAPATPGTSSPQPDRRSLEEGSPCAWNSHRHLPRTSAAVLATAVIGSLGTDVRSDWYRSLEKPAWQPPGAAFGPAWTTLYGLCRWHPPAPWTGWKTRGNAARSPRRSGPTSPSTRPGTGSFFKARRPRWALAEILLLEASTVDLTRRAGRADPTAATMLAPYAGWVAFATALNAAIARRNPGH